MKIAFVNQPMDGIIPPIQNSIGIWTYQVVQQMGQHADIIVYAKRMQTQKAWQGEHGTTFRFIAAIPNRLVNPISSLISRIVNNPVKPFFSSNLFFLEYCVQVALDLRREKCDVIHVHNFSQFATIIRWFNPKAKIVLHMGCEWLSQLDEKMIERRLQKVDLVLGVSEFITDKVRHRFPNLAYKCKTVFNGVDVDYFVSEAQNDADKQDLQLLFVGRVSPEKGIHTLLDALPTIAEKFPNIQLHIVGSIGALPLEYIIGLSEGIDVSKLEAFYAEGADYLSLLKQRIPEHLADRVTFTGAIPHANVLHHYRSSDILINPSLSEAFGMSLVEAMASETAVIATRVGGMPEIIVEGETGLLIEQDNSQALAEAIIQLLGDDDLRTNMGKKGRKRARELYDWRSISNHLLTLYRERQDG